MQNTVIGLYADYSQALEAQSALFERKFSSKDIELVQIEKSPLMKATPANQSLNGEHHHSFFFPLMSRWFVDGENEQDYHPEYHADIMSQARRLGGYLLLVQSHNHSQHNEIINILDHFDPMEISDHNAHWHVPAAMQHSQSAVPINPTAMPQAPRTSAAS